MKLSISYKKCLLRLLTLITLLSCPIKGGAQDEQVRFPQTRANLSEVIEIIERQTGYCFVYYSSLVDITRQVTLPAGQLKLHEALRLLEPQIGYNIFIKLGYILVNTAEPYTARITTESSNRTDDIYTPSNPRTVGKASNPRPAGTGFPDIPTDDQNTVAVPQIKPAPYSRHTPIDLYTAVKDKLPFLAVKTNLLYTATTYTPNIGFEVGAGNKHTVELAAGHNRWSHKADLNDNTKLMHLVIRPEYRYWFCERFDGHFLGAHIFYTNYNISGKQVPMLFQKEYRYRGWGLGAGVTYGYHWALSKRWGAEFHLGLGAAYLNYDRYSCRTCDRNGEPKNKTYFGPTRAGISLVFMIR